MTEISELESGALSLVAQLANELAQTVRNIADLEEQLRVQREIEAQIETSRLPAAMAELGMKQIVLESGEKITIKTEFFPSILRDRQNEAFAWLVENGMEDLIKNEIKLNFDRSQNEVAEAALALVNAEYGGCAKIAAKAFVHPQTLKALAREQFESGNPLPEEFFGTHIQDRANVARPKE